MGSVSRVNRKEECTQTPQGGPGVEMVALPSITMVREEAMGMAFCQPALCSLCWAFLDPSEAQGVRLQGPFQDSIASEALRRMLWERGQEGSGSSGRYVPPLTVTCPSCPYLFPQTSLLFLPAPPPRRHYLSHLGPQELRALQEESASRTLRV